MIDEVQSLLDRYWRWLRDETGIRQVGDSVEITTPYLDRHNDCLQIYATPRDGGILLTDDGYTVDDLEQSGCVLDSPRRQALLKTTLNGFGVRIDGDTNALQVHASADDFALRKHNLVQAMLAVNDLFYTASATVSSLFHEDVVTWLDNSEVRYTPNVTFTGKSGYGHRFDFVIPKSKIRPERVLRAINRPSRDTAQAMTFAWIDTREARIPESRAYAILNDSDGSVAQPVLDAMRNYNVTPIPWSLRGEVIEELAA